MDQGTLGGGLRCLSGGSSHTSCQSLVGAVQLAGISEFHIGGVWRAACQDTGGVLDIEYDLCFTGAGARVFSDEEVSAFAEPRGFVDAFAAADGRILVRMKSLRELRPS